MGESTRLEKILELIYSQVKLSLDEHNDERNPEICEVLTKLDELCFKLLHFDYFKKSEDYITAVTERIKVDDSKLFKKIGSKWEKLYRKDLKLKQKDLKQLFKLLVDCSEEL